MAKTTEELDRLQARLKELYHEALSSGVCDSQKSFAEIVGTKPQNMSAAMNRNERYLTDSLIMRIEHAMGKSPIVINMDDAHGNVQKNFGPQVKPKAKTDDLKSIVAMFTQSIAEERESHERIMMALIEKIGQN